MSKGTINKEPTRTQQQYQDDCDVNTIMNRYMKTGILNHVAQKKGVYADITKMPDYQTALQTVISAQEGFNSLPAVIRKRFGNDPRQLMVFLADPKNKTEAIELGLIDPPKPIPTPAPKTTEPPKA